MFQGQSIRVTRLPGDRVELCFDRREDGINKFDARTVRELGEAVENIKKENKIKGLLVTSAKDVFIVGADITEFGKTFSLAEEKIAKGTLEANETFNAIEDLPFPSCTSINGTALGGGLEMCLSTDYRVMSSSAIVGVPEVKLGIYPGFGGTVRLPRLIGADNAIEWIAGGAHMKAERALKDHAVDAVVAPEHLKEAALRLLQLAIEGKFDWKARREQKKSPLRLSKMEAAMVFESARATVAAQAGKHYPAPMEAIRSIEKAASKGREEALKIEATGFAKLAKTAVADALVAVFLNDTFVRRKAKSTQKLARPVRQAGVIGAGIMGGGIAYLSASRGIPVVMKDIADKALALGMGEANKLLSRQVEQRRLTSAAAGDVLSKIRPTLHYGDWGALDVIVEAVVENPTVKKSVLTEVEKLARKDCIIASNTSSISIDRLAEVLERKENFLGMHFFNPVHKMPLVEVIYGQYTSKEAIATVTTYASALGKIPITVKNCPGFLVNRVLFPYFNGFMHVLRDGADFVKVDRVMQDFGWPMGPAYLQDVVGMDTSYHVCDVLAEGYPDRMARTFKTAVDAMYENRRYGQKSGVGFYKYEMDPKGKPKKLPDPKTYELLKSVQPNGPKDMPEEEIVDRLMVPLIIEAARCLEEGIVESVQEVDTGLITGVGYPPFRGGALKYADALGLKTVVEKAARYVHLGTLYETTAEMKKMAATGKTYYSP